MLVPLTPPPITTTSAVWTMVIVPRARSARFAGERRQRHGLGRRPRREDARIGHGLPGGVSDQMRERGPAHAPLAAAHPHPRPGLHLVDVARAVPRGLERLGHRHLLAPA